MKRMKDWLPALGWMGVIFMMSAMPGDVSGEQSGRVVKLVMAALSFVLGEDAAAAISPDVVHVLVRKGAHMAEYAILFWLDHRALRRSGARHPSAAALMLCAAYACTDEIHQGFVEARGPGVRDVMIDTLGAALMWAFLHVSKKRPKAAGD